MNKDKIIKTIETESQYVVKFSEEEMSKLNIKQGDKFSVSVKDGNIVLEKFVPLELDLEEFSKDDLIYLVQYANDNNLLIEEAISDFIEKACDILQTKTKISNMLAILTNF